eukprot:215078_1
METNFWLYPTGIDHYLDLGNFLPTYKHWRLKKPGYRPLNKTLLNKLRDCDLMADPMYSIQMDTGHNSKNSVEMYFGSIYDYKLISPDNRSILFALIKDVCESNTLFSQTIKWDKNFCPSTIFKDNGLDCSPFLPIATQMAWGCETLFCKDVWNPKNKDILEAEQIFADTLNHWQCGMYDSRLDYPALTTWFRKKCAKEYIGIRKYDHDDQKDTDHSATAGKGPTVFASHNICETLLQIPINGNLSIYKTNKYEVTNKEQHAAITRGSRKETDTKNVQNNNKFRMSIVVLLENGGLDENNRLSFGKYAKHKLFPKYLEMPPINKQSWKALSKFIEIHQNPQEYFNKVSFNNIQRNVIITADIKVAVVGYLNIESWQDIKQTDVYTGCTVKKNGSTMILKQHNVVGDTQIHMIRGNDVYGWYIHSAMKISTSYGEKYEILIVSKVVFGEFNLKKRLFEC